MDGINAYMRFARARGDGLLPELEELLSKRRSHENVVDLADAYCLSRQAGPNPVGALPELLPDNVVPFIPSSKEQAVAQISAPAVKVTQA